MTNRAYVYILKTIREPNKSFFWPKSLLYEKLKQTKNWLWYN